MWSKVQAVVIGVLTVCGIVLAAFLKGRSSGKATVQEEVQKQENKAVADVAQKRFENVNKARDVEKTVASKSDSDIDKELEEWTRD